MWRRSGNSNWRGPPESWRWKAVPHNVLSVSRFKGAERKEKRKGLQNLIGLFNSSPRLQFLMTPVHRSPK